MPYDFLLLVQIALAHAEETRSVAVASELARASTTADPSAGTDDAPLWQEVVELRVGLARAEERAAAAERLAVVEIAARDQLVTELRGALAREREVASGMKDQLGQLTTKFDEQLCAMRAELVAARRPWWRRMLSG